MTAEETVALYGGAWNEHDEAARRAALEHCWAPDGVYCDPTAVVHGRDALVAHIAGFHVRMPGREIVTTSVVSEHHGWLHFTWRIVTAEGATMLDGFDVGERDEDGRLRRIVGFFIPPPA